MPLLQISDDAREVRFTREDTRIKHLKVVYSTEQPVRPLEDPAISCRSHCICPPGTRKCTVRRDIPGSTAFVPSVAGLIIAGEVVKDLAEERRRRNVTEDEIAADSGHHEGRTGKNRLSGLMGQLRD